MKWEDTMKKGKQAWIWHILGKKKGKYFTQELVHESHFFTSQVNH